MVWCWHYQLLVMTISIRIYSGAILGSMVSGKTHVDYKKPISTLHNKAWENEDSQVSNWERNYSLIQKYLEDTQKIPNITSLQLQALPSTAMEAPPVLVQVNKKSLESPNRRIRSVGILGGSEFRKTIYVPQKSLPELTQNVSTMNKITDSSPQDVLSESDLTEAGAISGPDLHTQVLTSTPATKLEKSDSGKLPKHKPTTKQRRDLDPDHPEPSYPYYIEDENKKYCIKVISKYHSTIRFYWKNDCKNPEIVPDNQPTNDTQHENPDSTQPVATKSADERLESPSNTTLPPSTPDLEAYPEVIYSNNLSYAKLNRSEDIWAGVGLFTGLPSTELPLSESIDNSRSSLINRNLDKLLSMSDRNAIDANSETKLSGYNTSNNEDTGSRLEGNTTLYSLINNTLKWTSQNYSIDDEINHGNLSFIIEDLARLHPNNSVSSIMNYLNASQHNSRTFNSTSAKSTDNFGPFNDGQLLEYWQNIVGNNSNRSKALWQKPHGKQSVLDRISD